MEYVTLNNGIKMPKLGYGVYQNSDTVFTRHRRRTPSAAYSMPLKSATAASTLHRRITTRKA